MSNDKPSVGSDSILRRVVESTFKRVIVTGSRKLKTEHGAIVSNTLDMVARMLEVDPTRIKIIHGGADGADELAACWARARGAKLEEHPAEWKRPDGSTDYGAGPRRNQVMVDRGAILCVAFWDGKTIRSGTLDCRSKAELAMIPTLTVPVKL